ncbi:MAG: hypothetical protein CL608_30635 [Anaerolineaceae bacterium]|nr:hypothetical protein [Anaerolineaceae bacterium]
MSRNKNLNQFDDLIDDLQQSAERPSIPHTFKTELRGQLLNQYEQSGFSWGNVRQWTGTAVALSVLAFIVFISWSSLSRQSGAASAYMGTVDVPGRDEFIVYDQLRIEAPMWTNEDPGWAEMTAESWQSLDGTFFRSEIVDADGKQRVFVQGDGQFLWRGTYDNSVERMETVSLQYFDVYHALAQAEGWAGNRTTPPFYDDVGWDGLVQSILRLDWQCEGAECVNKYLVEPPLGVNSRGGEYEPYGWGVSLIDTETAANGRSLTTYRIDYSPNQDGVPDSKYRLVKLDSDNHTVVEVADYDGETLLRRLERVSHQIMTSADLPDDQFMLLPPGTGVSYVLPEGRVTAKTTLLAAPNGEPEATLEEGTQVTLSGLMNNQLAVVRGGTTWQYVTVPEVGQGWVDESSLQWPLTSDGQLVDLDTSRLPTAVPIPTQLTILQTYQAELQALLPTVSSDEQEQLERLNEALQQIEMEITRLQAELGNNVETAANMRVVAQLPTDLGDSFHLLDFSISPQTFVPGQPVQVNLSWETTARPSADYTAFVHLVDESGSLLAQTDQSLGASSTFVNGTRLNTNVTLWLPDDLPSGTFSIVTGLYDSTTGQQLPSDRPGLYLAQMEVMAETAVTQHAVINGTDNNGLTLHRTPTGEPIAILDEGSIVLLLDEPRLESEGLLWQAVETSDGQMGWVVAEFLTYPDGYTLTETFPMSLDEISIIKVTQLTRTDPDETITLEVTIDYKLVSVDEAVLSLSFVHPSWGTSLDDYRYPNYNALGEQYPIQAGTGSVTITATIDPETITSALNSNEFGLMTRLWATDENGQQTSDLILMGFNQRMSFNVQSLEEINFSLGDGPPNDALTAPTEEENPVLLESVVQQERHTAVVTFQIIVEEPVLNANLQLFLVNPNWDFDRTNIQSFQLFLPRTNEEGLFVTATPEQIRQATGTDHPIIAAVLEPFDATNGTNIVQKFPEFPFDLTSREEIRYTPVNDKSNRNYLEIVDLTPPVGSTLRDETTFAITVQYNLVSLDAAELVTWLTPFAWGPAIAGNDVQTISQGEGEITFSFSFEPLETNVESDWALVIKMVDPAEEFPQTALATASPHDNFPDDIYHYKP